MLAPGRAGTTDANRANVVLIQADPVPAQIIKGREDPPQGWHSPGHGKLEPAPVISFDQTASDTAAYDTVVFPLDIGQIGDRGRGLHRWLAHATPIALAYLGTTDLEARRGP